MFQNSSHVTLVYRVEWKTTSSPGHNQLQCTGWKEYDGFEFGSRARRNEAAGASHRCRSPQGLSAYHFLARKTLGVDLRSSIGHRHFGGSAGYSGLTKLGSKCVCNDER